MPAIVKGDLSSDLPALLLDSCEGATPFFGLGFLAADDHSSLADLSSYRRFAFHFALAWFFLKLNDDFGSCWFGDIGDEMLDIELVLVELLLDLSLDLINTTVVLALQLCSFVIVVGVVSEQTLLGGLEDLSYLA